MSERYIDHAPEIVRAVVVDPDIVVHGHMPAAAMRLSVNRAQQHHDRFFAAYNLLHDRPDLPAGIRAALRQRCLSAAWKAARSGLLRHGRLAVLPHYLAARAGWPVTDPFLGRIAMALAGLDGIRRGAMIQEGGMP